MWTFETGHLIRSSQYKEKRVPHCICLGHTMKARKLSAAAAFWHDGGDGNDVIY